MKPYVAFSDIHAHAWTTFGSTLPSGVNNRLQIILDEMLRAAKTLRAADGRLMVMAGDLFHTRGVMDPEVLNPVRATIDQILAMGIDIVAIPGNHDLKSRDTNELSSAIQNLEQISVVGSTFQVVNKPMLLDRHGLHMALVPWRYTHEEMLEDLEAIAGETRLKGIATNSVDVFIHAGIDGVLSGAPAAGLTSAKLASYGFRRVFAGHYHNHHDFGDGVISIGATTHHTWGDIGTRAGFLMVDEKSVTFHDTQAPKFVDISGLDEDEVGLVAAGNYVRFRGPAMTNDQVAELRDGLRKLGALGVSIEVPRITGAVRATAPAKGVTTRDSILNFVDSATLTPGVDKEAVKKRAVEVFDRSRAVVEET